MRFIGCRSGGAELAWYPALERANRLSMANLRMWRFDSYTCPARQVWPLRCDFLGVGERPKLLRVRVAHPESVVAVAYACQTGKIQKETVPIGIHGGQDQVRLGLPGRVIGRFTYPTALASRDAVVTIVSPECSEPI
jgi:hypothetical protein